MCIQVIERYAVCRCLYYRHAVDPCRLRGTKGHTITERTILVGYICQTHAPPPPPSPPAPKQPRQPPPPCQPRRKGEGVLTKPDSGYSSSSWEMRHDK